jgi:hypothetical protein
MKKVLAMSDMHCGSELGLTPPQWQKGARYRPLLAKSWSIYQSMLREHGPFDIVLFGGDAIDGQQTKSKATGLLTADLFEQCQIAGEVFDDLKLHHHLNKGFKIAGVTGTGYHADLEGTSAERYIALQTGWHDVGDRLTLDVEGVVIDLRHHTGNSSVPYGGHTAGSREAIWQVVHHGEPTQCQLRGHLHRASYSGVPGVYHSMTLPALQLAGTKFGKQKCDGFCHFGIAVLMCEDGELADWRFAISKVGGERKKVKL